jgi:hypothetical protein
MSPTLKEWNPLSIASSALAGGKNATRPGAPNIAPAAAAETTTSLRDNVMISISVTISTNITMP